MFTFHNSRGSSNIDLTITNNNVIEDVNEWEISAEGSCSDHNFLKYTIGQPTDSQTCTITNV